MNRAGGAVIVVLITMCGHCSAQCSPSPPENLTIPAILSMHSASIDSRLLCSFHCSYLFFIYLHYHVDLRPKIGGDGTDWWTVFSATQVLRDGLWCQVLPGDNMGMGDNIGDWYYPPGGTPDGLTLLSDSTSNGVPYQSLKCANQIGLVVNGEITNNQGIVRCTTTISGLNRQSNYFVVYTDSVFENYSKLNFDLLLYEYVFFPLQ